ncbi:MAG: hypothetical protein EBT94_10265 [Alphaproteobacteria bacterium]|nr:hypothetical protein [Alphaproteobacteria bacterium]
MGTTDSAVAIRPGEAKCPALSYMGMARGQTSMFGTGTFLGCLASDRPARSEMPSSRTGYGSGESINQANSEKCKLDVTRLSCLLIRLPSFC